MGTRMARARRTIRLSFAGEVMLHGPVVERAFEYGGTEPWFGPMLQEVRGRNAAADLSVVSLPTPLASAHGPTSGYPRYSSPPQIAGDLAAAGFNIVVTASNHAFDMGAEGVQTTLDWSIASGLIPVGTRRTPSDDSHAVVPVGGVSLGFVAGTFGVNRGVGPAGADAYVNFLNDGLLDDVKACEEDGADFIVACLHWGEEYQQRPTSSQLALAAELAGRGVGLIVGCHAHVVQPIEFIGGALVAFGLGNLLSNQSAECCPRETQDGAMLHVELETTASGVHLHEYSVTPTWVDRTSLTVRDLTLARSDPDGLDGTRIAEMRFSASRTLEAIGLGSR